MRTLLSLILCCLLYAPLVFAQFPEEIESLFEKDRLVWIGETTYDYQLFTQDKLQQAPPPGNAFQVLKSYDYPRPISFETVNSPFFRWVRPEWLLEQDFSFYKDESLSEPLFNWQEKLIQKQEIETFDTESYEPVVEVIENTLDEAKLSRLRLRQIVYFDKRKQRYQTIPIALAPIIIKEDGSPELLYWIKLPDNFQRKRLPIQRKRFSWAVRSIMRDTLLEPSAFRIYKGAKDYSFSYLTQLQLRENKHDLYQFIDNQEQLSESLRQNLLTGETRDMNEDRIGQLPVPLSEQVSALRLVQIWLWDKRRERFQIYLEAVAPIHPLEIQPGQRSNLPLFYQR